MRLRELGRFSQWCLLINSQSCFYLFFNHWNGFHSQVPRIKFFQILHVKTASGLKGYVYFQPFLKKKKTKKLHLIGKHWTEPSGWWNECPPTASGPVLPSERVEVVMGQNVEGAKWVKYFGENRLQLCTLMKIAFFFFYDSQVFGD